MKTHLLYIYTRTPLHVGAGSSVGAIDQPVQRERHTRHPIIPGSSIKGVMRNHFHHSEGEEFVREQFGNASDNRDEPSQAGLLAYSEARPVLFPLRSAAGSYALATCPLALNRLKRDGCLEMPDVPKIKEGKCLGGSNVTIIKDDGEKAVVLEEYSFVWEEEFPTKWASFLSEGILEDPVLRGASDRMVLLSDEDFSHFCASATEIRQHVRIDPDTGTVDGSGLFNEEVVPSETLFYASLAETYPSKSAEALTKPFEEEQILQFGGNSTTGLGFCSVRITHVENNEQAL